MRSRCHCEGRGCSATLQPLPLPHAAGRAVPALFSLRHCPTGRSGSARGPLSPSSPPPLHTMNTSWRRHMHVSGMPCIHTLVCVFPTGMGRDVHEEWADLSLAPAPLLCPLKGAAWLPCSCTGLPSSSLTQHTMTRGVGPPPGDQRCLPEERQMFGKRQHLGNDLQKHHSPPVLLLTVSWAISGSLCR